MRGRMKQQVNAKMKRRLDAWLKNIRDYNNDSLAESKPLEKDNDQSLVSSSSQYSFQTPSSLFEYCRCVFLLSAIFGLVLPVDRG